MFSRPKCFGCTDHIVCLCGLKKFCPIHTPFRYGELCFGCYLGFLGFAAGLT